MKPRLLVVEDEAVVAIDIQDRLASLGYEPVGESAEGRQAIELVEQLRPDLVLMDIRLQGQLDGIQAAQEIRRRFQVPVVFLTAHSEDATLDRAKVAEPYGYVHKPFQDRDLRTAIEMALYKHQSEREIRRVNRLYAVLSQVNQAIVWCGAREDLFQKICRVGVEYGEFRLAWVGWVDRATQEITPVAKAGEAEDYLEGIQHYATDRPGGYLLAGEAVRAEEPSISNDLTTEAWHLPWAGAAARHGIRSAAAVPLLCCGKVCGALLFYSNEPGFFQGAESKLVKEVGMDLSFALDQEEKDSQRRLTEAALRESERRYRDLYENAQVGIYRTAPNGRVLMANPALLNMLGFGTYEELITADWGEGASAMSAGRERFRERLAREGSVKGYESTWSRRDGAVVHVRENARAVRSSSGAIAYFEGTVEDITEYRKAEQAHGRSESQLRQAQKMEAIGTLAGGIAHDFNNILSAILGNVDLAKMDLPSENPVSEYLDEVAKAGRRAVDLVRQILAFSRRQEQRREVISLEPVIKEAYKLLRAAIPSTVDFTEAIGAGCPKVLADASQVHQVVMNLCTNAYHALPERAGTVRITLAPVEVDAELASQNAQLRPGRYALLSVTDNGHGIEKALLERIFEPFFTTKPAGSGTGLGLSVVHGIVQNHDGAIAVYSEPRRGTAFHVYFPACQESPTEAPAPTAALPAGNGQHVMFVDDEAPLASMAKKALERLGYRVTALTNPVEALAKFRVRPEDVQLLITDLSMPGMNGLDLSRAFLSIRPGQPILLSTGFSGSVTPESVREMGLRDLILKPYTARNLAEIVDRTLRQSGGPG